ncbi:MAG: deaminase [Syntrophaceticus sp.]
MGSSAGNSTPWAAEAIKEAYTAAHKLEVPVSAVVVQGEKVIGRGHNLRERLGDPTAHAEILALRGAALRLKSWPIAKII